MKSPVLPALGLVCVSVLGCGSGDNSGAVKAHAAIQVGMPIWDALDVAERSQFPDIAFDAWGKQCSHPGIQVGRKAGPRFVRVLRPEMDAKYPVSGYAYSEEGFATPEEFVAAVRAKKSLFTACQAIVFLMGRYQGWPSADSFEVTVDPEGRIKTVSVLEEVRD